MILNMILGIILLVFGILACWLLALLVLIVTLDVMKMLHNNNNSK